jgi:hypothetical protein
MGSLFALASPITSMAASTIGAIVSGNGVQIQVAGATYGAASAWQNTHAYGAAKLVSNGGNLYASTVAGTSAGSGGPTGTGTAIADGTVTWCYVGTGAFPITWSLSQLEVGYSR